MIELCQLMSRLKSGIWPILGLKLAILATFFEICPTFTIRLIGKPNKKSIGHKITSLASKKPHKWPYLNSVFFAKFLAEMGSKFFGGLNQKSESISFSGI